MNGRHDQLGLGTTGALEVAGPLRKFIVGQLDGVKKVADIGPWVMFALMPALGALLKRLVVPRFIVLNDALETDVAPDLDAEVVGGQEEQESGDAAITVTEGVNTQEVQVEGGLDNQRGYVVIAALVLPK